MSYPAPQPWMKWASEPITFDQRRTYRETGETIAVSWLDPDVDGVEVHCDKADTCGAAVSRQLGYRLDRVESRPVSAPAESGMLMVWTKSFIAEAVRW